MMPREAHEGRLSAGRSRFHRLLPIAGLTAAVGAVLAHLGGGAVLMHIGLPAVLAYLGADVANLGGAALVVGLAVAIIIKLLLVFGARRWWQHR